MITIRQNFDPTEITDHRSEMIRQLERPEIASRIHAGDRVAVCVGSRGIHCMDRIAAAVIEVLEAHGAKPFLIPAMGSHGRATPEGQAQILASRCIFPGLPMMRIGCFPSTG